MDESIQRDLELLNGLNGVHVGLLTPEEQAALNRLVKLGLARRGYSGVAGTLGVARVVLVNPSCAASDAVV